jgi:hypothetical protein
MSLRRCSYLGKLLTEILQQVIAGFLITGPICTGPNVSNCKFWYEGREGERGLIKERRGEIGFVRRVAAESHKTIEMVVWAFSAVE